jgi:hypothetical protein
LSPLQALKHPHNKPACKHVPHGLRLQEAFVLGALLILR